MLYQNVTNPNTYNVIMPYCYKYICLSCNVSYLFIIAMASNDNLSLSEEISSGTNLSGILTENEEIVTTNWTLAKRKKTTTYERIP